MKPLSPVVLGLGLLLLLGGPAAAQSGLDSKVQPPEIGVPARGSLAGQLASVAYGPGDLWRGSVRFPSPFAVPTDRGPLLAEVFPVYAPDGGLSEWGLGWQTGLALTRWRASGDLDYATDDLVSPWGYCKLGVDGYWYPVGLSTPVRIEQVLDGFIAYLPDGTRWTFGGTYRVVNARGTYSWLLREVATMVGRKTRLTYEQNLSGRFFLTLVEYGGYLDDYQYRIAFTNSPLRQPLTDYRSGAAVVLDRFVSGLAVQAKNATTGLFDLRWSYALTYAQEPIGPAFFLTRVEQTFASLEKPPPVVYDYNFSGDALATTALRPIPKFDQVLLDYSSGIALPDRSTAIDADQDGLVDLEAASDNTLIVQTETGYTYQPLPPWQPTLTAECRAPPSFQNVPRTLAQIRASDPSLQVVSVVYNPFTAQSTLTLCDRIGNLAFRQPVPSNWELGPNTRLADLNRDHQPDLLQVSPGAYTVIPNQSTPAGYAFGSPISGLLQMNFNPIATWVHDANGDGIPDIITRFDSMLVVFYGKGNFQFEPQGAVFQFIDRFGFPVNLTGFDLTFVDANNDGLMDVLISAAGSVFLFLNNGTDLVEKPVPGLANMGADISLPMFNDFGGSGNVEVFFTKLGKANSIALTTAGTSLLRSADDGKGTQIVFTYARGPIAPGQGRRNPVIARVTATSTGNGTVIKDYGYQSPRIHSTGKFFIGYDQVSSADPFVSEVDAFLNDDRYSGVFLSSRTHDTRTPAVDKFEYRLYGDALFQGIPWKRLTEQGGGWQGTSVPAPPTLAEKTQFLTYEAEVCPATSMITKAAGTLNVTTQHEFPPAFAKHLSCLVQRTVQSGAHADPALDFRHETLLTRNALGQVTQVQALALAGALTLQTIGYNADSTVDRILTPGRGTTVFGYDPIRRLLNQVTTADGVITTVTGRGAATDLIQSLTAERGAGPFSQNFSYDGQERLQKRWNNLGAATALNPNEIISYRFATSLQPAMTSISTLVDGVAGIASNGVEYATAAGEPVATAHRVPEGWSFGNVQRRLKAAGETQIQLRPNLLPADDPLAMTYDGFFVGASLINDAVSSAFGSPVSSATSFHVDVQRRTAVTLDLSGGALRQTTVENGLLSTAAILDSAKRVVSFQDEAQGVYGYAYDALGRLRRVTLPDGKVHRAIYDDYGRVRRVERDGIGAVDTVFDPTTGFPTSKSFSSPAGVPFRRISWTYDSIGRESVALHADLTGTATQTFRSFYDGQTPTAIAPLNAKGLLTAVAGDGYVKTFEYRLDGLLRKRAVSLTGWRTIASEYIYLDDGSVARRITTVLDAAGAVLSSAIYDTDRDAAGRLSAERLNGLPLATFNYDSLGRPSSAVFAGGGSATLGYDGFTRGLVAISQQATAFSSSSSLRWNARGLVDSESIAVGALSLARQHGYSPQGFLTNSADPQSSYVYSYDAIGLPTAIQTGATIRSFTQVGDVLTVGTTQYQFDGVGRTIRRDDLSFLYGPNGQIASANRGLSEWRFLYDEQDRRLVKLSGGAPVAAFLDEGYLDPSGLTEVVQFGGRPVGLVRGGAFQLIGSDPRGSAIADVTGAALVPSPFGSRTARPSFAAALDYVEKGYDADLGVVRMGVRDYDPEIDRFLTPDPLFLEKPELCLKSPVECNLYGYARSNPLKFVDPTGQEGQTWGDWARNKEQWIDSLSFLKPMCSNCNAHSVMGEPAAILKGSLDFLHVGEGLAAAISDPTLSPTQRAMQAGADVLRVIQIATVVGVVFGSVSSALSSAAQTTGQGFRSFSAFKQALGPAGPGQQWHHIVEQTPGNVARFGGEAIHNTGNLVRLGTAFHRQVSGLYSSIRPDITGSTSLTVRQWLSTQSFQAQGAFGQRVLQNISNGVWP